jgi:hypothetical protein
MSNLSNPPRSIRLASLVLEIDSQAPSQFLIHGVTLAGTTFRPSDWVERLCGVLAPYQPGAHGDEAPPIGFSPYARPIVVNGAKCVRVDAKLGDVEPMALRFVISFARDNELVTTLTDAKSALAG